MIKQQPDPAEKRKEEAGHQEKRVNYTKQIKVNLTNFQIFHLAFTCDVCRKEYASRRGLKEHLKTHMNARNYAHALIAKCASILLQIFE